MDIVPVMIPLAAVVTLAALALLVVLWRQRRGALDTEPRCTACGYIVVASTSLDCPECGADLRKVGISTQYNRRGVGPIVGIVLWTLILPLPAVLLTALAFATIIPIWREHDESYDFVPSSGAANVRFSYEAGYSKLHWPWQDPSIHRGVQRALITWDPADDGREARIEADFVMRESRLIDARGRTVAAFAPGKPVTQRAVLDWLAAGGMDNSDPQTQTVADDLVDLANDSKGVNDGNVTTVVLSRSGGRASSNHAYPEAVRASIIPFWVVVWLIVSVWLYRRLHSPSPGTR